MFLLKFVFWVITLPVRLVFFAIGTTLWVVTLPLRMVFSVLALIGFSRLFQLAVAGGVGYALYRLVNSGGAERTLSAPQDAATLRNLPST